jgi:hypothetical protein
MLAIVIGISIESNYAAYRLTALQGCKSLVDAAEADALGNQLVEHQSPVEICAGQ